jgi:hypothetical protein
MGKPKKRQYRFFNFRRQGKNSVLPECFEKYAFENAIQSSKGTASARTVFGSFCFPKK